MNRRKTNEDGYTLIALLGLMAVLLVVIMSIAPNLSQQAQRAREEEAMFRGEEVADSITAYLLATGALPTTMKQLTDGVPRGIRKVQIIRPSATRDPLTKIGEWQMVAPNDAALTEFQKALTLYYGGPLPPQRIKRLQQYAVQTAAPLNLGTVTSTNNTSSLPVSSSPFVSGPFIGVASKSARAAVINYYGIDHHNLWVFTPLYR